MASVRASSLVLLLSTGLAAQATTASTSSFYNGKLCYDQARSRLLVFAQSQLWEWDGVRWAKNGQYSGGAPDLQPVYAPSLRRVVGVQSGSLVAYDGHSVEDLGPVPWGSDSALLAVDAAGSRLHAVHAPLTGGMDLYELAAGGWQQLPSAGLTTDVQLRGLAFDEARDVLVAFTYVAASGVGSQHQIWEYDGSVWALREASASGVGKVAFDPARQQIVDTNGFTWRAWDGATWTSTTTVQAPRGINSMTPDHAGGRLWALDAGQARSDEVWASTSSGWDPIDAPHPQFVGTRAFYYDPSHQVSVAFGRNQHLEWDGHAWHTFPMPAQLTDRADYSMCFDPIQGKAVLFGGMTLGGLHDDTWTWDGTSWQLVATTGPAPRRAAAITYDAARQRVVLIGGLGDLPFRFQDHWEWDGNQWSQVHATVPWGVNNGSLGYDRVRSRLVHVSFFGDTYEYDGANWTLLDTGANSPAGLELTWVASRQALQTVLWFGAGLPFLSEWNGSHWVTLRQLSGVNVGHVLGYDSDRDVLLDYYRDALVTTTATAASTTAFGTPCGGQQIRTSLTAFGVPRPGDDAFHLDLRADATLRPAVVGLATDSTQVPIGNGCELLLQNPFGSYVWFVDQSGLLHLPVSIPEGAQLRGLTFAFQGAVLDPSSPGGLAMSQGLRLAIGD